MTDNQPVYQGRIDDLLGYVEGEGLAEFVRQSNRLEGIEAEPGDPLFDDHLLAAQIVEEHYGYACGVVPPKPIHAYLMRSEPHKHPGEYRTVRVMVGGEEKVAPGLVELAMSNLLIRAESIFALAGEKYMPSEQALWDLHHEFEHIHPFVDGNGRTGRLWLNALRLACGYPWLTVRARNREAYYAAIRRWERAQASWDHDDENWVQREGSMSHGLTGTRAAGGGSGGPPVSTTVHPAIVGLLQLLPPPGTKWRFSPKQEWLAALTATVNAIYPTARDDEEEA